MAMRRDLLLGSRVVGRDITGNVAVANADRARDPRGVALCTCGERRYVHDEEDGHCSRPGCCCRRFEERAA